MYTSEREFLSENTMNIQKIIKKILAFREQSPLANYVFVGILLGICLMGIATPKITSASFDNATNATYIVKNTSWVRNTVKKLDVVITAYTSTPDQTDDSPFITASNKYVKDGIIANNMLPFGTKVRIPELYGNKVFTVEDRMNKRKGNYRFDIWMADLEDAIHFGVKKVQIEVLES